jgi:hypothetical protein
MRRFQTAPENPMLASFLVIFVAFAACQALLTVKFADFLSADRARNTVEPTADVANAKLA